MNRENSSINIVRDNLLKTQINIIPGFLNTPSFLIGLLENLKTYRHFIITDDLVNHLYAKDLLECIDNFGFDLSILSVSPGDESKSLKVYARLADEILKQHCRKESIIISLGGGMVNNLAGFIATTLFRGIGLIHIPTTLMAQVDACVDFKQAVNSKRGKNLIGSIYPAGHVIIDSNALYTLDDRQMVNGIAEPIKHGLVKDKSFLDYFLEDTHGTTPLEKLRNSQEIEGIIRKSIALKMTSISDGHTAKQKEMITQYGHSVGHAVEFLSGYDILHGEAICIGMCVCAEIACLMGISDADTVAYHYQLFNRFHLPTKIPISMRIEEILACMKCDRHCHGNVVEMSLVELPGRLCKQNEEFIVQVEMNLIKRALEKNLARG